MQRISKVYFSLTHWRDFQLKLFGEGILIGAVAGLVMVAFRYSLERAEAFRESVYSRMATGEAQEVVLFWFVSLTIIAYVLNRIVLRVPMAAGSGIPQVKGVMLGLMKMDWLRVLVGKFIGGVLAIGAGLSLGREGPSIQLGAATGQGLSRLLGRSRMEERYLLTSGASAGLAAAFNAPLAGVIFSLEELHKSFSPAVLMSAIASALTATVVSQAFYGDSPVFAFAGLPVLPVRHYGIVVALGLVMGLLGAAFNRGLLVAARLYEQQRWLSGTKKAALPLVAAGAIGFVLPQILGGGHMLVNELAAAPFPFKLLCVLFVAKFCFTLFCYGSGVPGGIFLPMLVIGALAGSGFSQMAVLWGGLEAQYSTNIVVLAMAAYFSAVVKAPITGSILIMEMTGSFQHMLSLIVVSMAAYLVADLLKIKPIYEALLDRSLEKQGKATQNVIAQKRSLTEVVVCINSKLAGRQIKDIEWPPQSLLVSIKRGDAELVPRGATRIRPGDYLYLLADAEQTKQVRQLAEAMNYPS